MRALAFFNLSANTESCGQMMRHIAAAPITMLSTVQSLQTKKVTAATISNLTAAHCNMEDVLARASDAIVPLTHLLREGEAESPQRPCSTRRQWSTRGSCCATVSGLADDTVQCRRDSRAPPRHQCAVSANHPRITRRGLGAGAGGSPYRVIRRAGQRHQAPRRRDLVQFSGSADDSAAPVERVLCTR